MKLSELTEYFKNQGISGPPHESGMYLVEIKVRGIGFAPVSLAHVYLEGSEPGECFLQVGPWEGYLKLDAIKSHLPLRLQS